MARLKRDTKKLNDSYKVTMFNRPHQTTKQKAWHYLSLTGDALLILALFAKISDNSEDKRKLKDIKEKYQKITKDHNSNEEAQTSKPHAAISIIQYIEWGLAAAFLIAGYLGRTFQFSRTLLTTGINKYTQVVQENNAFQQGNRDKHDEDLIEELENKFHGLFPQELLEDFINEANTTAIQRDQTLALLSTKIEKIEELLALLEEYLQSNLPVRLFLNNDDLAKLHAIDPLLDSFILSTAACLSTAIENCPTYA